jgi:hypothetical protein
MQEPLQKGNAADNEKESSMNNESNGSSAPVGLEPVVSATNLLASLMAEYEYWRAKDDTKDEGGDFVAMGATGALSNVICFATVKQFRADWHPEKEEVAVKVEAAEDDLIYAPGEWQCEQCGFRLVKKTMYAQSGEIGMDHKDDLKGCPNDGLWMKRVTWKQIAIELGERLEQRWETEHGGRN